MKTLTDSSLIRVWALMAFILIVAACAPPAASPGTTTGPTEEVQATEAPLAEAEEPATPAARMAEGFDIDLSGQSLRMTSAQPSALQMTTWFEADLLREWGADVELIISTTTTALQALLAGRSDISAGGADELILGAAEGADVVAIASETAKMNYVLVAREGIDTVEDLEGQTIGMSGPAGFDALLGRFTLREAGLDPETDANFTQIGGSPDRAAALLAGNIDAATIFLDDWFELEQQTDELHLLMYMADLVPEYPTGLWQLRSGFLGENPDVALAVACGALQTNKWIRENKDEFIEYTLANTEGATEEGVEKVWEAGMEINMWPTDPDEMLTAEGMQGLMEAMVETGDISQPVDVSNYVDTSYLEQAAEMGCGQ